MTGHGGPHHPPRVRRAGIPRTARARTTLRQIKQQGPPKELKVTGFFTDGGLDGLGSHLFPPRQPEGSSQTHIVNDTDHASSARHFWVENCFGDADDPRCFCSDIATVPDTRVGKEGSLGARNVWVGGRLLGALNSADEQSRRERAERRDFIISRLAKVAEPMWGWNEEGFGGLRSASTEQLEEALVGAWQTPGLRHLLIGDLPPSQRQPTARKLAHIVSNLKPPPPLVLTSLIYKGHRVLVEHTSLRLGKQWQGERDRQKALKAPAEGSSSGGGGGSASVVVRRHASRVQSVQKKLQGGADDDEPTIASARSFGRGAHQLNNFAREPKPVPTKAMVEKRARMLAASNSHGVKVEDDMAAAMADEAMMTALAQGKSKEEAGQQGRRRRNPS